jgi:hypothetical protein
MTDARTYDVKLPGRLPVHKPSEVPYCLANGPNIPLGFVSESQPPTGSLTLIPRCTLRRDFSMETAHLQVAPLCSHKGKVHDAWFGNWFSPF